jgi:signal transduction histidine kinase
MKYMQKFVRWPLINVNRRLAALLLLLLAATVASVIYLSYVLLSVNSLIKQGSQAVANALTLQDLYINVQAAESAQRGYIITGNASYLQPYNDSLTNIPHDIKALDQQAGVENGKNFKQLQLLIDKKLSGLHQSVAARQEVGFDAATAVIATNQGQALMNQIRVIIYQISSQEFNNIIPRETQSQRSLHVAVGVGIALVIFVMGTCLIIIRFFQTAILRERAVEGAKNEFLSLASHQLRTPATNVRQYLGLVLEGYLGRLTKNQREALEVANRNNNTEISIINDLLNVAKLDLNQISLHKAPLDLSVLAQQVATEYHAVAETKHQVIRVKSPASLPKVAADETYIKSALENLVDNACKYSPAKSTVTVRLMSVKPTKKKQVAIEVTDKGIGISKRDISKLFKKFSRLPTAIDNAEGTGLGLYWVKQIVELHNGSITISSSPGKGSTFRITLPIV